MGVEIKSWIKTIAKLFLILLLGFPAKVFAGNPTGSVCFGENLAKPFAEHSDRLYLKINNSPALYFNRPQTGPVLNNLDLNALHKVVVYFDNKPVNSWTLDFKKLNTRSVLIWRAAGSWRMEAISESECRTINPDIETKP
jgi:hypothetical protein